MNATPNKSMKLCPVCNGKGTITEDTKIYEFITRDPQTNRCLFCNGKGFIGKRKNPPPLRMPASGMPASPQARPADLPVGSPIAEAECRATGYSLVIVFGIQTLSELCAIISHLSNIKEP
ncbi:MAG: hypothetical protein Q8M98_09920 [Candidatus Cloacimonadaceae bacterium]|nr:hypothetical protein [Candidatus Cloacimonadaceae bacterium]